MPERAARAGAPGQDLGYGVALGAAVAVCGLGPTANPCGGARG